MYEATILKGVVGKGADLSDWTQVEPVIHMTKRTVYSNVGKGLGFLFFVCLFVFLMRVQVNNSENIYYN